MAKKSKPKFKPRPWTARDDEKLAAVVRENRDSGIVKFYTPHNYPVPLRKVDYAGRLKRYAEENFRTYEAVRKRASRLGLRSYPTAWSWQEQNFYADPIPCSRQRCGLGVAVQRGEPQAFPDVAEQERLAEAQAEALVAPRPGCHKYAALAPAVTSTGTSRSIEGLMYPCL